MKRNAMYLLADLDRGRVWHGSVLAVEVACGGLSLGDHSAHVIACRRVSDVHRGAVEGAAHIERCTTADVLVAGLGVRAATDLIGQLPGRTHHVLGTLTLGLGDSGDYSQRNHRSCEDCCNTSRVQFRPSVE